MPEELDDVLLDLDDEPSDEASAEEAQGSDLDSELEKEGVELLTPEELADPAKVKAALLKRVKQYHGMTTKKSQQLSAELDQIADLKAKALLYDQAVEAARQQAKPVGPPEDASPEEVLEFYFDRFYDKKIRPILESTQQFVTETKYETAKQRIDDFDEYKAVIYDTMRKHPTMTIEEAYRFVTADSAEARARAKLKREIAEKKRATTLTRSSAASERKPFTPADLRAKTTEAVMEEGFERAMKELNIQLPE